MWSIVTILEVPTKHRLGTRLRANTNYDARLFTCLLVPAEKSLCETEPEVVVTFDMEEDFEKQRWRLLALIDCRQSLNDESKAAAETDLMISATRELIRTYETLKGYWSQKAPPSGRPRRVIAYHLEYGKPSQRSGSPRAGAERDR
jgi:hypothetical protein